MALIRLIFLLVVVVAVAGAAFYFAPDEFKEKGLDYIGQNQYIPNEVKKVAEDIFASPALKRKRLLAELEENLSNIQSLVEESEDSEEVTQLVERTKEIVEEVLEQNNDPTLIRQITDTVTANLAKGESCEVKTEE